MTRIIGALLLCFAAGSAAAQDKALKTGVAECVQANMNAKAPVATCLQDAVSNCTFHQAGSALELDCYRRAKDEWGALIMTLLDGFADREEKFREIARIEAKYSVSRNIMNCARQMELNLIGRDPGPADRLAQAVCESQAVGLSYVELLLASGAVKSNP